MGMGAGMEEVVFAAGSSGDKTLVGATDVALGG